MKANSSAHRRGVALVIVLVFVVLLSVFILSFFTNSQNELGAAQSFSGEISAQQLAETATSVVMGQIREATIRPNIAWASQPGMIRTYGDSAAETVSDKADAFFKLYSSDDMIVGASEFATFLRKLGDDKLLGGEIPIDLEGDTGWDSQPALFTDLNAPITLSEPPAGLADGGIATDTKTNAIKFPIIDGHDIKSVTLPGVAALPAAIGGATVLTYDSTNEKGQRKSDNIPDIEGFAIDPKTVKYNAGESLSATNSPVPMPVKWLYVLRDGTLTAPTGVDKDKATGLGTKAKWEKGERGPTKDNPIVGRIGFWADDDTCKVNVNTAGGFNYKDVDRAAYKTERSFAGSYWDAPRVYTRFDYGVGEDRGRDGQDGRVVMGGLSITQPVAKEYQRYPGHPATTSLALLFKDLLNSEQIYSLLPRMVNGGTMNGRERFYADKSDIDLVDQDEDEFSTPLTPKRDRMFASVDEFLFGARFKEDDEFRPLADKWLQTNRKLTRNIYSSQGALMRTYEDQLDAAQSAVTPELLERMRFFLTAHSRAPELNLFGRPRVTIWPSYPDPERLNASDRVLNFCSIIGPRTKADGNPMDLKDVKLFQFQRSDPYSSTADWDGSNPTKTITGQIRSVPMPKMAGGTTRNQFIYRYLQDLTSQKVPGFKESAFDAKYPNGDRDQILTEIFDYMRCVNMRDSTRDKGIYPQNPKDPPNPQWQRAEKFKYAPLGVVVPIQIKTATGDTRGFGRFPTITEASIVLYHTGYENRTVFKRNEKFGHSRSIEELNAKLKKKTDKEYKGKEGVTHNTVSAFMLFETFNPMMGYAPTKELNVKSIDRLRFAMEVTGLKDFTISSADGTGVIGALDFPATGVNYFMRSSGSTHHGRNLGGPEGFLHLLWGNWNEGQNVIIPHKWGNARSSKPQDGYYEFQGDWPGVAVPAPENPEPWLPRREDAASKAEALRFYKWHAPANADNWQKLRLTGAKLKILIKFGTQGEEQTIRTLDIEFPSTVVPMPTDFTWSHPGGFFPHPMDVAIAKRPGPDPPAERWACTNEFNRVYVDDLLIPNFDYWTTEYGAAKVKRFGDRLLGDTGKPKARSPGVGGIFDSELSGNNAREKPPGRNSAERWRQLIQPGDVVRSMVVGAAGDDPRIMAINDEKSKDFFTPHEKYREVSIRHAQILRTAVGHPYVPELPNEVADDKKDETPSYYTTTKFGKLARLPGNVGYATNNWPDLPFNINGVKMSFGKPSTSGFPGDYDTGLGNLPDGPFTNKADEGNPVFRRRDSYLDENNKRIYFWVYPHAYYNYDYEETFDTFFTPNRQTPSAVVFGSLPLGKQGHWATLAFSPFSASEGADPSGRMLHPGRKEGFVRDHLLLDLFNMPIVEPYAISEPFSTGGKVNMNYPMMPFSNIERSTALRAVMHSVRVSAFPTQAANTYKSSATYNNQNLNYRYPVNRDLTLRSFRDFFDKFKSNASLGMFKSASEICDRGLYPLETTTEPVSAGSPIKYTSAGMHPDPDFTLKTSFWGSNQLTGDNMREKPYSDLYPRLTTKSNTYTVHVRAQALRQTAQSAEAGVWDEKKDRVIGEYRGSSTVERFIDPEDARFDPNNSTIDPKDKIDVDKESVEPAYRFRVINTKRFVP